VRLLLDTHTLVWSLLAPDRIPDHLAAILVDPSHTAFVSAVSFWEVTIKVGLGKLSLPLDRLEDTVAEAAFDPLPISSVHGLGVRHLPPIHRDPFDRLLIAQARHEGLTLVTHDATIQRYPVATLWD
jgi:PIN domain nuclease of toxin-antitoxin system